MTMLPTPDQVIGLAGLVIGAILGALVYRARLCTFGAMEDALIGQNWRRMKVFGLALVIAMAGTQLLIMGDWLDPDRVTYLPARLPLLGLVLGGVMFGLGMAFVGTCGFGSLLRLGTGDLRAIVVVLIFSIMAFATLRGVLSGLRIGLIEQVALPMPGPSRAALTTQLERLLGFSPEIALVLALTSLMAILILRDKRLMRSPRLLLAGTALGLAVPLGWALTSLLSDPFALHFRPQSLTFVAPVARATFGVMGGQDSLLDFGVASVFGVVLGAMAAAMFAREFRWEAFDDHHEMRRHMIGAALMGVGGVLAGGCTIGQGLSAGSLFALSMPIALAAMMLGARLGIAMIMGEASETWARLKEWVARP